MFIESYIEKFVFCFLISYSKELAAIWDCNSSLQPKPKRGSESWVILIWSAGTLWDCIIREDGMRSNVLLDKCNWSLLRIFRVIVQEGSLNKAAVKLFLTKSAISQSLKRLEEQIGETLIIRTGGKFYLTETGEIVFEASMMIYSQLMDYEERLNTEKNSLSGTIKLLVLSGFVAQSCS